MVRTIKQFLALLIFMLGATLSLNAQNQEATLTVFGDGANKNEAIKVALRSAIEQTFGVFVSSNTKVINDELVKDEIATVASGNVKHFDVVSEDYKDGKCFVSVSATVSVGKLIKYCQQQGLASEATIDVESFLMNQKLKELNEYNKKLAIEHFVDQIQMVYENACNEGVNFFDYQLEVGEPVGSMGTYGIPCLVHIKLNDNFDIFNKKLLKLAEDYKMFSEFINDGNLKPSICDDSEITDFFLNNIFSFEISDGLHKYTIKQLSLSDMVYSRGIVEGYESSIQWDSLKNEIGLVDGVYTGFNSLPMGVMCGVSLDYGFYDTCALLLNFFRDEYRFGHKFRSNKEMVLCVNLGYISEELFKQLNTFSVTPRKPSFEETGAAKARFRERLLYFVQSALRRHENKVLRNL